MNPIWLIDIFQMGWFNHQLEMTFLNKKKVFLFPSPPKKNNRYGTIT